METYFDATSLHYISKMLLFLLIDVRDECLHPDFCHLEVHEKVDKVKSRSLFPES
jgi:hypothetical protein